MIIILQTELTVKDFAFSARSIVKIQKLGIMKYAVVLLSQMFFPQLVISVEPQRKFALGTLFGKR